MTPTARWEKWVWVFLTLCLLYFAAHTVAMAIRGLPDARPLVGPPAEWVRGDYPAAHRYADWCGGYVYDDEFGNGPWVGGCDQ